MMRETYHLSSSDVQGLLCAFRHPSVEYAKQQRNRIDQFCAGMTVKQKRSFSEVEVEGLDLSFLDPLVSYVNRLPLSITSVSFSTACTPATAYYGFAPDAA